MGQLPLDYLQRPLNTQPVMFYLKPCKVKFAGERCYGSSRLPYFLGLLRASAGLTCVDLYAAHSIPKLSCSLLDQVVASWCFEPSQPLGVTPGLNLTK